MLGNMPQHSLLSSFLQWQQLIKVSRKNVDLYVKGTVFISLELWLQTDRIHLKNFKVMMWLHIEFFYCSDWSSCGFKFSHSPVHPSDLHRSSPYSYTISGSLVQLFNLFWEETIKSLQTVDHSQMTKIKNCSLKVRLSFKVFKVWYFTSILRTSFRKRFLQMCHYFVNEAVVWMCMCGAFNSKEICLFERNEVDLSTVSNYFVISCLFYWQRTLVNTKWIFTSCSGYSRH